MIKVTTVALNYAAYKLSYQLVCEARSIGDGPRIN